MGVKLLKPAKAVSICVHEPQEPRGGELTSNWKLGASSDELKEVAALRGAHFTHDLEEMLDALAVEIVAVIGFERVHESWK